MMHPPLARRMRSELRKAGNWLFFTALLLMVPAPESLPAALSTPVELVDVTSSIDMGARQTEPITPLPDIPDTTSPKVMLGERLFADTRLSGDGSRSCLSCHDIRTNGADSNRHDLTPGGKEIALNTTTVFNAALNFRLNWEGNFRTLEEQAAATFESPGFMGTNIDAVIAKLQADPQMTALFTQVYGHGPDRDSILDAIATYERSLITPGSRFDLWLKGDGDALTDKEKQGYGLFKSLGCISCHQGVNIGGNLYERHGIFRPLGSPDPELLRVPSLRNVATTAPYFHDGSAPTLNIAVRRMAAAQLNRTLTDDDVDTIVSFLRTLTGSYHGVPVLAPAP
jgi:cytochrome c peroxidase